MVRPIAMWLALVFVVALAASPAVAQPAPRILVQHQDVRGVPPAVMRGDTLFAPLDGLLRPYGASARWDPAARAAEISGGRGIRVTLRAGESRMIVNGESYALPAAPFVAGDTLLVPVKALFQALGAWVKWEPAENTMHVAAQVTRVALERTPGGLRVVAEATGPIGVQLSTLPQPDRLIVDFANAVLRDPTRDVFIGEGGVRRARAAQFQTKPYVTRVVFDLDGAVEVAALPAPGFDRAILIRARGGPPLQVSATPAPTATTTQPTGATPSGVPSAPAPRPTGQAPGIAGPAPGATGAPSTQPTPPPPGASQPPTTVADVPTTTATPPVTSTPPSFASSSPIGASPAPGSGAAGPDAGTATTEPPRITDLSVQRVPGGVRIIVQGDQPLRGEARELPDPNRLVIDLPGVFTPVRQEFVLGGLVEAVRGAQFAAEPTPVARVVLQWRHRLPYQVFAEDGGNRLVILVQEQTNAGGRGVHVVAIDAGHGGRDPGAIGATGLLEKDVVLDVAQRLRAFLAQRGVRVVMTRDTDVFVELGDRVPIAAQAGATVFVSVHANASQRAVTRGSETYYLQPNSQALATMIQEEMGRALGIPDRGIRTANFKVLRDASIPACLVEIAYLSNVSDEELLRSPAFRQLAAESIGRGILRFLATLPPPSP